MFQGAAEAIEDAAVLGVVLSRLPNTQPSSINKAPGVYETIRKGRAETLVKLTAIAGHSMYLGEGAEEKARDRQFEALGKAGDDPVPDRWADAEIQRMVYGTHCAHIAREKFDARFGQRYVGRFLCVGYIHWLINPIESLSTSTLSLSRPLLSSLEATFLAEKKHGIESTKTFCLSITISQCFFCNMP